jgi:lipoprotein NlpI
MSRGDVDRAIADFTEAIRLTPSFPPPYGNRCLAYDDKGDFDRAITDCNEAIRLNPNYVPAYLNRGLAYHAEANDDRAIADYDEAIQQKPLVAAYDDRSIAYFTKGDYNRAITDLNEAIRIDPTYSAACFNRGLANLYGGTVANAVADLSRANQLIRKNAYAALWLDIADRRSNLPSRLAETTSQIDMSKWPGPIVSLYLGRLTPAAVLTAADDPNEKIKKRRVCQASFFIGELGLQRGAKDDAMGLFRSVVTDCARRSTEWRAANAELKAVSAPQ